MPSQLFRVTRPSDADPITEDQLMRMMNEGRDDEEWAVCEVELCPAKLMSVQVMKALRQGVESALGE